MEPTGRLETLVTNYQPNNAALVSQDSEGVNAFLNNKLHLTPQTWVLDRMVKTLSAFRALDSSLSRRVKPDTSSYLDSDDSSSKTPHAISLESNSILPYFLLRYKESLPFSFSARNCESFSHLSSVLSIPITVTTSDEQHKSWRSSLCSFLQPHVTSFLPVSYVIFSNLSPGTFNLRFYFTQGSTPIRKKKSVSIPRRGTFLTCWANGEELLAHIAIFNT